MYRIGQRELDWIAGVFATGNLFRYLAEGGAECERFETRYAERLGVRHCLMTASGTNALTAALMGAGVGPGDEVIVPACTYMATPMAVLAAGAIPVIVDIAESLGMSPDALRDGIGPRTRAVIPVHMWGLPCDMDSIMETAADRGLLVIEDACQAVGGAYEGRMLGSIGDVGAFSFNYYKKHELRRRRCGGNRRRLLPRAHRLRDRSVPVLLGRAQRQLRRLRGQRRTRIGNRGRGDELPARIGWTT